MEQELKLLTLQEVAARYGVRRQAVSYWIARGYLIATRPTTPPGIRSPWLVEARHLEGFLPPRQKKACASKKVAVN